MSAISSARRGRARFRPSRLIQPIVAILLMVLLLGIPFWLVIVTAGKDQAQAKATFPALIGVAASRERLLALAAEMEAALAPLGERGTALAALARQVVERDH